MQKHSPERRDSGAAAAAAAAAGVAEEVDVALGSETDPVVLKAALEREKLALERERLALEREQLRLDRERWQADRLLYDRRRKIFVLPGVSVAVSVVFCLIGIAIGSFLRKPATIQLDARKVDSSFLLKSGEDGEPRPAIAYLLMMK
jgi:hypothetical protein